MTIKYDPAWVLVQKFVGADADGLPGGQTLARVAARLGVEELWKAVQCKVGTEQDGVPGALTARAVASWLGVDVPGYVAGVLPQSQIRSGRSVYGKAGDESVLVSVPVPAGYPMMYEGRAVKSIRVHRLAADWLAAILKETLAYYGEEIATTAPGLCHYSGSYNDRSVASGTAKSMHAWGLAIDLDAANNAYEMDHTKARLARPEYRPFWDIVRRNGGFSLGERNDRDWMHFQFASWS